jgi:hypothetical protein
MAYVTTDEVLKEGVWYFTAWQPRITDDTTFQTWVGTIVTRVGNHVKWRVGAARYGTTDPTEQAILKEAELCLAQYYLLLGSAGIADTSDDPATVPAVAHGERLREDARAYLERVDQILAPLDGANGRPGWARPVAAERATGPRLMPEFVVPDQRE